MPQAHAAPGAGAAHNTDGSRRRRREHAADHEVARHPRPALRGGPALDRPLPAGVPGDGRRSGHLYVGGQLTLTAFLVGITIGQLIFGPLSDRFGRLRLLIGAVLCVVASIVAVIAPNVAVLVGARLVQGIGGAAGMVIGRAIISDVAHGRPRRARSAS